MTANVDPRQLQDALAEDPRAKLIDVRSPAEFRDFHVQGATNVPLDGLDGPTIRSIVDGAQGEPIYVVCRTGRRSQRACELFQTAGFDVTNVAGGSYACEQAGLPIVRGKKTVSLERQVRIVAGSLVAVGVALGAFVSPWFLILPGFVGAGLVFSGVTDFCGMGLLLARMPWNQVQEERAKPP
jgi:rhodanese-related sulfurtransferase